MHIWNDSEEMFFKKSFLLTFQGLLWLQKLVVGSSSIELTELTPSDRPIMVTRGGVWSWSMNFLD